MRSGWQTLSLLTERISKADPLLFTFALVLTRLVALRWPLYYHAPSLVQHTGRISTWGGGGFHTARDFVEDWAAG